MSKKFSVPTAAKTPLILYGRHAVTAALANPERKIAKLLCTAENAPEAKKICAARGLPEAAVNIVDRREIDRILPRDAVHQGFALYCSELPEYSLEDICILAADKPDCHLLILDQVTDPQNIGAVIRSCVAFDTLALIMQDKYKTGITFVDDEHRKLFEIISDTNDLIHDQLLHDKYDEIMRLLAELRDYTELHFSEEEALMERIHYPELPSQKRAHAAFVDRLVNIDLDEMEDLDDNQQVYLLDLIQFLLNWLANHILACDKKIGEYMRENHISE